MSALIGISTEFNANPDRPFKRGYALEFQNSLYPDYVRRAGGLPVFISSGGDQVEAEALIQRLDGLLLSGGSDLDPALWGEAELAAGGHVEPIYDDHRRRTRWEDMLFKAALKAGRPVLGICRGMQQMNVSLGGSLWQDLERQLGIEGHYGTDDPMCLSHRVEVLDSEHAELFASALFAVTSTHHQAVHRLGEGLQPVAQAEAESRLLEALRYRGPNWVLGVQWHPERMRGEASAERLMQAFLAAACAGDSAA